MRRARREHHQPVEAKRDASAFRQAIFQRGDEIGIDRIGLAIERVLERLVGFEAALLLGGIGQLAEGIREFEAADIKLEALAQRRIARLEGRESAAIDIG